MVPEIKLLGEKILANGRFKLSLTSVQVVEADGAMRRMDHEIYHHKGAAALLLYDPTRGKVLLVRQFRLAAYLEGAAQPMIEVCAGMLDGDAPEACVVREAMEETGVAVADARHVFDAFVSPGATTEKIACFVARYGPADRVGAGGGVDADEHIEIIEPAFGEALGMIERGDICDAKTIALLYYARARGLMDAGPAEAPRR
jgi:nudix-type nucleoside diphosphatase (YffH/AdpP family)